MKTFSMTHVGRRREMNQDYMYTSETAVGNLPNLFLVADGMGGHAAGEYASKFTVEKMVEKIGSSSGKQPVALIKEAVEEVNALLLAEAEADASKTGMGTTIMAATVIDGRLYAANVGDSRLYVINREQITQITRDHSLVEEMVRLGEMDKEAAKDHPDKNIITRAVGVLPEVAVDFFEIALAEEDTILMCSDGLTNMVEDSEIKRIVLGQRDIVEKAEKLVEAANQNGGRDNITVVLIEPFSDEVKEC
ncbi:MAG: Stp1/IreP family PP2C-type Ser/Thr phosphatase [Roseburia sp.]|nr:Stp1/IreP family PP2C-type Ser/Thr phosphatase [Roseburia sp.]